MKPKNISVIKPKDNTNQETYGTFFKNASVAIIPSWKAWDKFQFENKLPKLLIINIFDLI